jgi:hypothetical protein
MDVTAFVVIKSSRRRAPAADWVTSLELRMNTVRLVGDGSYLAKSSGNE